MSLRYQDFRIDEPEPIGPEDDAPVKQTIHMTQAGALELASILLSYAHGASVQGRDTKVSVEIRGYRMVPAALEGMLVRGRA